MKSLHSTAHDHEGRGYKMINEIEIKNYRCFRHLKLDKCRRINIVVGDNGAGKTALLEAIFLALASSPLLAIRHRQQRGLDGAYAGAPNEVEKELWQDFFYNNNFDNKIEIKLIGSNEDNRSLKVTRKKSLSSVVIPLDASSVEERSTHISFEWTAYNGKKYVSEPEFKQNNLEIKNTGEVVPNHYMFAANQTVNQIETAQRFSSLDKVNKSEKFINFITNEYQWINDVTVQTVAGSPALFASIKGQNNKIPLANVSGGINRWAAIMLALYGATRSAVLVDEIENGLFHGHQDSIWRGLISSAQDSDCQLIMTTHSHEWLVALTEAVDDFDDIALWRIERENDVPVVRQFAGKKIIAAINAGDVR